MLSDNVEVESTPLFTTLVSRHPKNIQLTHLLYFKLLLFYFNKLLQFHIFGTLLIGKVLH